MKKFALLFLFSPLVCTTIFSQLPENCFKYMDPLPGAKYVTREASVILLLTENADKNSLLGRNSIEIRGTKSGLHEYDILSVSEHRRIILKPRLPFAAGEIVTVAMKVSMKDKDRIDRLPYSYSFTISDCEIPQDTLIGLVNELSDSQLEIMRNLKGKQVDFLEAFPVINVTHSNNPSPGFILLSNIVFDIQIPNTPYLIILKNDGTPLFSRQMQGGIYNFDRQPNGNFTYFSATKGKHYELDTNYVLRDSFYTGNGYLTDLHELRVLPNRHVLLMSYDVQVVNMSQYIEGGNANALVTGLILQEIDENKNVVFQWRSWDHYQITDATHENLLNAQIDYVHGNAIEIDTDGNILLSSRNMDEITKINRVNGNIIWRLGGRNNQFTFTNDPEKFCYQHAIRRISNGNITLYDNGNYHPVSSSRAVEYQLDETNHTATVVWQYHNSPYIYGGAMGYVQRLNNGNTLIGWGAINPTLSEVRPDGSKALEITFATGVFSYRVYKYEFGQSITSGGDPHAEIPGSYSLSQNYPNPFNPATKIKFYVMSNVKGQMSNVKMTVYDVIGEEVQVLVNQHLSAGTYEIDFDARNLPSGVYYYELKAGNYSETRKMVLIK